MRTAIFAAMALALAACQPIPLVGVTSPNDAADRTSLDEQAGLSVELAYQAAALAVLTANRAGLIPAERRADVARIDEAAFAAVTRVRAAYAAGNAATYGLAVTEARRAVADLMNLAR